MIDWIKTAQGIAAIVAAIFATMVAWRNSTCRASCSRQCWRRFTAGIAALGQFNCDTRLLLLDQAWWSSNPLGMPWPELDAAFVTSGGGQPPAAGRRPPLEILASE